jgi:hypothetical protein
MLVPHRQCFSLRTVMPEDYVNLRRYSIAVLSYCTWPALSLDLIVHQVYPRTMTLFLFNSIFRTEFITW